MLKKRQLMLFITWITFLTLSMIVPTKSAYAESGEDIAGATGFTYSLTFPENQMEDNIGYYKLKVTPGQEQTLAITVSNPSAEKVTIDVSLNGAKTNQNGVIEYGDSTIDNDESLKYDFVDLVTGPEKVELEAGETKKIELKLQIPETGIEGVIAGGIQLMKANQDENVTNQGGSHIINQYAYVIGLLLQESEEELAPDLKFNQVFAGQNSYRNTIFVDFSNIIPAFLNEMTVETQITAKGRDAVLFERKQTGMRMAPNSFIQFPISMNGERMVSGTYVATTLVTSGDQRWEWTEEFEITREDANKFNEQDVSLVPEKGKNWVLIAMSIAGAIVIVGSVYYIIRIVRKRKEKEELEAKKARKKKKAVQVKKNKQDKNQ
ncbi:DUF916 and DUF3324 domain-containing protein [Candidatus Enterococcus ikei]|uniref:DUF916 and DUF3324 domain-containing protein n=1 Tax=Candidatus Enterococcus ikei TaxID=2815326 RepID=A0ABS3H113_9ENTE|nr:DUF916 and DUF3324 domain-containing protein [Enterococcus sp. DIV0869a]MBO0441223.1 DUF916 and DUF3324 domain-containing protein [Enterococcus sp. DIV0869a]